MKRIELTKLSLLNFKGARNVEINFHGNTTIAADNGVGKSTLFDAFVWLLFGKNAEDRKDFSIKTYDTNGEIIPRIPHEVSAVINVNGENISLRRCFNEKWTKRRGSATEEFTGHEEERFWNEVPCSLKDWNTKIAELIPEQTFKMVTNPRYFVSQKADIQRATLIKMAGSIKDQDIVAGDSKFIQLLQDLQGKTLDEYKRQISAKKNIVKAEIKGIPDRIDERKRDIADAIPEADANNKMAALKLRQENIEEMLTFRNKSIDEINARREQANKKINAIQAAINERERQIITEANKELLEAQKSAMMNDIGKKTEGVFAEALKFGIKTVENYENVGKAIVELLAVLGPVKATMVVVNMLQQHHNKIMREAVALRAANTKANIQMSVSDTVAAAKADLHAKAVKRLNIALTKTGLTNPYVLLAAGAAALGLAIYKAHQNQNKFNAVLADIDKAAAKNTATINVEITKLERLKGKLAGCKEGSEEYLSAKNEIIDNFAKYDETLKDEGDSYDALKVKLDALTDSIKNTLSARAAEEELATKTEELTEEYAENINNLEKKLLKKLTPEMAARAMQEISLGLAKGTIEAAAKTETKGWWSGTFVELKGVSKAVADAMKEATMTGGGYISALGSKIIGLVDDCKDLNKEMTELPTLIYGKFGATLNEKKEEVITNNNGNNNNENENEDEEDAKKKAEERKKAQKKYKEEIKEAIVKGEHDIAQAQIDAMEEGAEKQDAQLRLNYNKRLNEIKRQEENYKQKNKELYGSAELTDDQKRVLQQMRDLADNELNVGFSLIKKGKDKQTEDKLKERLQMWQEYCEKQTAITEEYAEKRKKIEDDKTLTEEDRNKRNAQLDQQERNDIAILIAQMGITDQNIADELTKIIVEAYSLATDGAVEKLQNQLLVVETQLQEMLKSGVNEQNEEVFRRLQTQQKALTKAIVKAKSAQTDLQNKSSKAGLTIKDKMDIATGAMSSLNGAIGEVRNAFGDLFDDVTNDALDAIQTTMESGIGVLNAIKAAGVGTATAISTAEKASVILTVISAAVQVTMALVKALSNFSASAKARKMAEGYKKAADSYRREYEKLRHEHRNSVGTQYYDEMFKDINALYKEEKELEKAIRAKRRERNLAATDKRKEKIQQELNDLEDQRRELEEKIEDEERKFYENMLTTNATDYASTMADQLVEGWESGLRDMTSVFDDAINDMLRSVVKSQLRMKLEEIYKTAFDEMQKDFGSTSEFTQNDLDAIKDRVNAANEEAKAVADFYRQWWDALELNTGDLSASVGAIQGMTQDTAEELNGRFTALQMSGASIDLKMDSVVAGIHSLIGTNSGMADSIALAVGIASDQLNVLEDIRNHTARLASMERSLNTITNQMSTLTGQ